MHESVEVPSKQASASKFPDELQYNGTLDSTELAQVAVRSASPEGSRRFDSASRTHVMHVTECLGAGTLHVLRVLIDVLHRKGVQQTLVYATRPETPPDVSSLFPGDLRLIEVARASGAHVRFARELSAALQAEVARSRPQHIHLHSSKAGFVGRLALRRVGAGTTIYYSPHGLSYLDPAKPLKNSAFRALERAANIAAFVPVGCGAGEAELLYALTGRPAAVLENPVSDDFFSLGRLNKGAPLVATVGRISRQKAPDVFASAVRRLRQEHPSARFRWIGDGDAEGRQELEAAGCEVTGWKSHSEVCALMAETDVYVQTSRWEGLPISVIQAMASGIPSVVTDVIGNRDTVIDGLSGYVAKNLDALVEHTSCLIADADLRESLGACAKRQASERFSIEAFSRGVSQLYGLPV